MAHTWTWSPKEYFVELDHEKVWSYFERLNTRRGGRRRAGRGARARRRTPDGRDAPRTRARHRHPRHGGHHRHRAFPNLHWHNLPLQQLLHDDRRTPLRAPEDLVRVQPPCGVGAGLAVGGRLVHGAASDAGEIGHVVIDEAGGTCGCGKVGCLETSASVPALTARIGVAPDRRDDLLAEAGHRSGLPAPVVGMLGLQHIVIGGPAQIASAPPAGRRPHLHRRPQPAWSSAPTLELTASTLGADAVLLGAAALVLLGELGVG